MPIFQRLLDLDEEIQMTRVPPIIVNDLPNETETDLDHIFQIVTTQYFGDKISMIPSCQCGYLRMQSLLGNVCPRCHTMVQSSIENDIQPLLWFRKPDKIKRLMSPFVFTMLRRRFTKQGWDVIQWLIDPTYKPVVRMTPFMTKIMEENLPRGWNNFVEHFDRIFLFLIQLKDFAVPRGDIDYLYHLWRKERKKFFCDHLPLPNRTMFVFENTNLGIYRNASTDKAMQYVSLMLSIDRSIQPLSDRAKENRVAKLHMRMSEYQESYIKDELSPKHGQIRRHNIAGKTVMSCRAVITSITRPWDYECIEIPWFVAVMMLRPMVMNKLLRRGYSINDAANLLMTSVGRWDPVLDQIFDELIAEAPNRRIHMLFQRNPTLKQGASQMGYIKIKRDPADKTLGIPLPVVKAPNASRFLEGGSGLVNSDVYLKSA